MREVKFQDLQMNPNTLIANEWMLVTAGNEERGYNTMTASWGHLGSFWGHNGGLPTAIAYLRPLVMRITIGNDVTHENIPYGGAIDERSFLLYTSLLVVAHEVLFFGFESLGSHLLFTLFKIIFSSAVTILLVWVTARLFRKVVA